MTGPEATRQLTSAEISDQLTLPFGLAPSTTVRAPARLRNNPFVMVWHHFPLAEGVTTMRVPIGDRSVGMSYTVKADPEVGMATQRDKYILAYAISAIADLGRDTGEYRKVIRIPIRDFILSREQSPTGSAYERVKESLERLLATRIYTQIEDDQAGEDTFFTWISRGTISYRKRRVNGETKKVMHAVTIELCDFLHNLIQRDPSLVTYSQEYLKMTSPLLQRIYEVAKANLTEEMFRISGAELHRYAAPTSEFKDFKKYFRRAIERHQERLQGADEESGVAAVPEFAIYPYSAARPETSSAWNYRTAAADQYFVFVPGVPQGEMLDVPLSEIPDWDAGIGMEQIEAFAAAGSVMAQEDEPMRS